MVQFIHAFVVPLLLDFHLSTNGGRHGGGCAVSGCIVFDVLHRRGGRRGFDFCTGRATTPGLVTVLVERLERIQFRLRFAPDTAIDATTVRLSVPVGVACPGHPDGPVPEWRPWRNPGRDCCWYCRWSVVWACGNRVARRRKNRLPETCCCFDR